ncbi:unnamed protein product [Meloidogyne enterolobii]|uniref:Uncharacterized protein n=1 Tax=Meloidogyne enterolobii TaxID=390850 RepID=A0ACB1AX73_MELEN
MKTGLSKLFELQPDPYDNTQSKFLRICLVCLFNFIEPSLGQNSFTNVENASELREFVRKGEIDAALIRAELLLEPFVLLAAANRAVHQAAHNRMITRSLSAELIYSLSPNRNISDSLNTFGIAENSQSLVVAIFDDVKGKKMISIAKRIKGTPVSFELLREISDLGSIKQIYQLPELDVNGISMSDLIVSRIVTKEIV